MRIGISVDPLSPQLSGIGRYTWELCHGLQNHGDVRQLTFYRHSEWISNPQDYLLPTSTRRRFFPRSLRRWNSKRKFQNILFHGTNYFLPEPVEGGVVTVHDLSVFLHPETHPPARLKEFERDFERTLKQAAHIITDSETGREELIAHFGWNPSRVSAISLGVSASYKQQDKVSCQRRVSDILGREIGDFILSVATFEPRKRIENAIRAHAEMCARTGSSTPLILVGAKGWNNDHLHGLIEAEERSGLLIFAGFVDEADLPAFYAGASLFLYPSIYEGFGLPPIEAMASGTPVIVSNRSCLPEVTKGAAYYIEPDDIHVFSSAIEMGLEDEDWRAFAIQQGLAVAGSYTWNKCVSETLDVYRHVLSS